MALENAKCGCKLDWLGAASANGLLMLNYGNLETAPTNNLCRIHRKLATSLCLRWNRLTSLPEDLSVHYPNLSELYLASNYIQELPECIGDLINLKNLDVSHNKLSKLPDSITKLKNLKELHAVRNSIKNLPHDIGNLKKMVFFDISWNELYDIPSSIGGCESLQNFYITINHISTLPSEICNIPNLEHFSISKNDLLYFPIDFGRSMTLKVIDMDNNNHLHYCPSYFFTINMYLEGCGKTPIEKIARFHDVLLKGRFSEKTVNLRMPTYINGLFPSLKELASRAVARYCEEDKLSYKQTDMPNSIWERLHSPLGHCLGCGECLFWMAHAVIEDIYEVEDMGDFRRTENVLFVAHFCSPACAKWFSR